MWVLDRMGTRAGLSSVLIHTFPQVKWVFAAALQSTPQTLHDYTNVLQPGA